MSVLVGFIIILYMCNLEADNELIQVNSQICVVHKQFNSEVFMVPTCKVIKKSTQIIINIQRMCNLKQF